MLTVATWKWGDRYTGAHVNALARQVHRQLEQLHRFVCVTNDPAGIDPDVVDAVLEDRSAFADTPSPEGRGWPSCYRRLELFHPDAERRFGARVLAMDLDTVVPGRLDPIVDRPEAFVILRDPVWPRQGQGSLMLLSTGSHAHVWSWFDPATSPALARAAGYRGSDQAWVSYCTPHRATWGPQDGVYSYRRDLVPRGSSLPRDARVVSFHGRPKPWESPARELEWVRAAVNP